MPALLPVDAQASVLTAGFPFRLQVPLLREKDMAPPWVIDGVDAVPRRPRTGESCCTLGVRSYLADLQPMGAHCTGLSLPPVRLTSEDIVLSVSLCCHCAESVKRKRGEAWAEAAKRVKLVSPSSCDSSSVPHCIIDFLQQALPFWPVHAAALVGQHHASIVWGLVCCTEAGRLRLGGASRRVAISKAVPLCRCTFSDARLLYVVGTPNGIFGICKALQQSGELTLIGWCPAGGL